jgi:hypothetical protein
MSAAVPTAKRASRITPAWPKILAVLLWSLLVVLEIAGIGLAIRNGVFARDALPAVLSIAFAASGGVGAVVAAKRPRNPIGWLLLGTMLDIGSLMFLDQYSVYGLVTSPGAVPGAIWAAWASNWMWVAGILTYMTFVPLLFPDGKLPSPRWRVLAYSAAILGVVATTVFALQPSLTEVAGAGPLDNPVGVDELRGAAGWVDGTGGLAFAAVTLLSATSLVTRYRNASEAQRTQLKWIVFAFALLAAQIATTVALEATHVLPGAGDTVVGGATAVAALLAVPVAAAIAILKHRLFDIDRIINRTITYTLLTLFLGLVYSGLVVALQALYGGTRQPPLVVAVSTLAAAALFRPARARIQAAIDRRFNRRRYDAARTIEGFTARLRDEIDLDSLTKHLLAVVDETMEPAHISLWLRSRELSERPIG